MGGMSKGYPHNFKGIIAALIDKFGLVASPVYGPPYDASFKGIIECIQDLAGGSGTGTGGLNYSLVTGSTTATAFGGYIANSPSLVVVTLPSTATIGDPIGFYALTAAGFRAKAPNGHRIRFGDLITDAGTYIQSTEIGDALEIAYLGSNTWGVTSSQGNLLMEVGGTTPTFTFPPYYTLGQMGYTGTGTPPTTTGAPPRYTLGVMGYA